MRGQTLFILAAGFLIGGCIQLDRTNFNGGGNQSIDYMALMDSARGQAFTSQIAFQSYKAALQTLGSGGTQDDVLRALALYKIEPIEVVAALDAVIANGKDSISAEDYGQLVLLRNYLAGDTATGYGIRKNVMMIGSNMGRLLDDIEDVDPAVPDFVSDIINQVQTMLNNLQSLQDLLRRLQDEWRRQHQTPDAPPPVGNNGGRIFGNPGCGFFQEGPFTPCSVFVNLERCMGQRKNFECLSACTSRPDLIPPGMKCNENRHATKVNCNNSPTGMAGVVCSMLGGNTQAVCKGGDNLYDVGYWDCGNEPMYVPGPMQSPPSTTPPPGN